MKSGGEAVRLEKSIACRKSDRTECGKPEKFPAIQNSS
jgi:hypothetical protein